MGWSVLFFKKKEEGNHAYKVKFEHEMYKQERRATQKYSKFMEIVLKTEVGLSQDAEELWGCEGVQGG